jgi:hypothetical protein
MRIDKNDIPVKIGTDVAVARQKTEFGDARGYGTIGGEYFTMKAGTDLAGLLEGLDGDLCHAPHWGYLIDGTVTVTYADGNDERVTAGDLFYWPPGHTVKADSDTGFVMFSPQHEHTEVMDHVNRKIAASS